MSKLVGSIVGRKEVGLKDGVSDSLVGLKEGLKDGASDAVLLESPVTTRSELGDCDGVLVFGGPEGEELGTIEGAGVRATKSNTLTCPVQSGISSGEHLCASVT